MTNHLKHRNEFDTARQGHSRRDFLGFALTASAGVALLPFFNVAEAQSAACVARFGQALRDLGEIKSDKDGVLRGVIDLVAEQRAISYYNSKTGVYTCVQPMLRTYHGYQGWNTDVKNRVTQSGVASPGPLLRSRVGGRIELIFLNRIDAKLFPRSSVTSARNRCDTLLNLDGTEKYPGKNADGTPRDTFPNCFHASSTSNLHFHGTHVSPRGFEDNVLVGVINHPHMDARVAIQQAIDAYGVWASGEDPTSGLIESGEAGLKVLLARARADNNKELVEQVSEAIHTNEMLAENGEWPQYWPGLYPHRFTFPAFTKGGAFTMGQSPGTHWYHCHQHGSTTAQILNGMAGVLIVTGDYDDKMLRIGGGTPEKPKIKEQVLMFQLFGEQPNLLLPAGTPTSATMACNGQVLPTVSMKRGEVQWWRIANAAMRSHGLESYVFVTQAAYDAFVKNPATMLTDPPAPQKPDNKPPPASPEGTIPVLNQTAQDGVQFQWKTYGEQSNLPFMQLSPGNRADFLVKAPLTDGTMYLVFWPPAGGPPTIKDIRANTVFKLVVSGAPSGEATVFPKESEFPDQPSFLGDISDAELSGRSRTVTFSMEGGPGGAPNQPIFKIDGEQFQEGEIDQIMLLGNAEEWKVVNTSLAGVMHPFHIHINPFQVTEVYDPFTMKEPQVLPAPWIWWDTFPIPPAITKPDGTIEAGYFKMRSRFVDFPGKYVLHCHILGHEDRGMMQLVEVVDNKTVVKHH